MSLWGTKDAKNLTGTVSVVEDSVVVTGSGTAFTTELKPGNTIVIDDLQLKVAAIVSDTVLHLDRPFAEASASGQAIYGREIPAYVPDSDRPNVLGVDVDEASASVNRAKGINTPGFGLYTTYVDNHGVTRNKFEPLVAMKSVSGDDDNLPTAEIAIITQPEDVSGDEGDPAEFVVVAEVTPSTLTINYQWQESSDGTTFTNIVGATSDTLTIPDNTGLDGTSYRVVLTATDAIPVTSTTVTLTVV